MSATYFFLLAMFSCTVPLSALRISVIDHAAPIGHDNDDLINGGPDWVDEEEHWEDFQTNSKRYVDDKFETVFNNGHIQNSNDTGVLQFVHVGKCGGSSINEWLHENHVQHRETHRKQVQTCNEQKPRSWLISVRDPIDRAASSFNWRSPRNGEAHHGQFLFGNREKQLYECFESFNDFAEALDDETTCAEYARRALNDPKGAEHLGMGLAWYLDSQLDCILKQNVFLVHTESISRDLENFGKWMAIDNLDRNVPHIFGRYPVKKQTYISQTAKERLSKWLQKDYELLQKLKTIAVNREFVEDAVWYTKTNSID